MEINYEYDSRLSQEAIDIMRDRYMLPSEKSPQEAFARAAKAFADNDDHAQRIYEYAAKGWFMFASPILSNGGTNRGLPISCFGGYVDDSRGGITDHYTENAWLSSLGGGIGGYWGHVRSNGTTTSMGSRSTGVIPFIKVVDSQMLAFSQGSTRRGSYAAYMDISHPEIREFILMRKPTGGDINRKSLNLHNAVVIPDTFMEAVLSGNKWELVDPHNHQVIDIVDARELWELVINTRVETGEPYIMWSDTVNRALPSPLRKKGLEVVQSNLCVAPETKILTDEGYRVISDIADESVSIWNGAEWSTVVIRKTSDKSRLLRVTFSDGTVLECTPEHKFYIQQSYNKSDVVIKSTQQLSTGDMLEKWELSPIKDIHPSISDAYSQGFYSGDGNKGTGYSWLYSIKYVCANRLCGTLGEQHNSSDRKTWKHGDMLPRDFVPLGKFSIHSKVEWLSGLLDADGTVVASDNGDTIQLVSIDFNFLNNVRLMLQELGVHSKISVAREAGDYLLPANDGSGEDAMYQCQKIHRVLIGTFGVRTLLNQGLNCSRLRFQDKQEPQRNALHYTKVVSVEDTGRIDATYCFTEAKRSRGTFNGIVTGQCSEIVLPTDNERTFVCCLSSVNLEFYKEWYNTPMVRDLVRYLDNVLTYFIENAPPVLKRAVFSAMNSRDIGIGAMGFHAFLQRNNVPFESATAKGWNKMMFENIRSSANYESVVLAGERGKAPDMGDYERRNAHLIAIAPNATSSIICGTSPSVEPYRANIYTQKTLSGSFSMKNTYLKAVLQNLGMDNEEVWKSINQAKGSVQHLDFLDEFTKAVFKTAPEIDQRWIIEHAADRQPNVCQAQSINLFFTPDEHGTIDAAYLNQVHLDAWRKGLKTLYYLRSETRRRSENIEVKVERKTIGGATFSPVYEETTCLSCEG